jgi:hypothetical protein
MVQLGLVVVAKIHVLGQAEDNFDPRLGLRVEVVQRAHVGVSAKKYAVRVLICLVNVAAHCLASVVRPQIVSPANVRTMVNHVVCVVTPIVTGIVPTCFVLNLGYIILNCQGDIPVIVRVTCVSVVCVVMNRYY